MRPNLDREPVVTCVATQTRGAVTAFEIDMRECDRRRVLEVAGGQTIGLSGHRRSHLGLVGVQQVDQVKLGEKLIAMGYITIEQLWLALLEQRHSGDRLGEILVVRGWVDQNVLTQIV